MQKTSEQRRGKAQKYPSYAAEVAYIKKNGITEELLNKIIRKHRKNAAFNRELIERYEALDGCVPIFERRARFESQKSPINHRINNDFFSEIVDFKTGYFAGNPIAYSYGDTRESLEDTAEANDDDVDEMQEARDIATKQLTDFVVRSNMFDKDMEVTKYATICGYAGRLFYIDPEGMERVMIVPPYEAIILSESGDITQPTFGVRYYTAKDIDGNERTYAEFYDSDWIIYAEGSANSLKFVDKQPNLFGMCPLQGIPNNLEMLGDAEKVLALIDAYDRALSDANNEIDSFANAYMKFRNVVINEKEFGKLQEEGGIQFDTGGTDGDITFLTKEINDAFVEHHLDRLEENIYRFSKTPNLTDENFGQATGVALKFKLTGLETKCGMFEAKMISAGTYMFALLAKVWEKRRVKVDPLQCTMTFKRNFPLDLLSEAQAAQALIAAGVPDRIAYELALSGVDDIEWLMQEKEKQMDNIPSLADDLPGDEDEAPVKKKTTSDAK